MILYAWLAIQCARLLKPEAWENWVDNTFGPCIETGERESWSMMEVGRLSREGFLLGVNQKGGVGVLFHEGRGGVPCEHEGMVMYKQ